MGDIGIRDHAETFKKNKNFCKQAIFFLICFIFMYDGLCIYDVIMLIADI